MIYFKGILSCNFPHDEAFLFVFFFTDDFVFQKPSLLSPMISELGVILTRKMMRPISDVAVRY